MQRALCSVESMENSRREIHIILRHENDVSLPFSNLDLRSAAG